MDPDAPAGSARTGDRRGLRPRRTPRTASPERFDRVQGVDIDRHATGQFRPCARLPKDGDIVGPRRPADRRRPGDDDAVLHHMDLRSTLEQVADPGNPGGRFPLRRRSRGRNPSPTRMAGRRFRDHQSDHRVRAASVAVNGTGVAAPFGAGPGTDLRRDRRRYMIDHAGQVAASPRVSRHTIAWTKPTATIAWSGLMLRTRPIDRLAAGGLVRRAFTDSPPAEAASTTRSSSRGSINSPSRLGSTAVVCSTRTRVEVPSISCPAKRCRTRRGRRRATSQVERTSRSSDCTTIA